MVQYKSKASTSEDTSSSLDTLIPTKPVTPKLISAKTVLEKLQHQDRGFYVNIQNLTPQVEFFKEGAKCCSYSLGRNSIKLVHHLFTPLQSSEGSEDQSAIDPEDDDTLTNISIQLTISTTR
ncbi:hypothetical protein EDD22DRAFT_845652 [Suillus occidentalis]|nr:hypothetical protein EDD22DRAFT_845652 [Suillus occidentalis]